MIWIEVMYHLFQRNLRPAFVTIIRHNWAFQFTDGQYRSSGCQALRSSQHWTQAFWGGCKTMKIQFIFPAWRTMIHIYITDIKAKHLQNSQEEMNTMSVLKRLMFLAIKREHRCKCLITFASIPCLGGIEKKCIARNQQLNQDLGRGVRKQSNARIYCYSWQLWAKICRTKALLPSYIFNGHSCLSML